MMLLHLEKIILSITRPANLGRASTDFPVLYYQTFKFLHGKMVNDSLEGRKTASKTSYISGLAREKFRYMGDNWAVMSYFDTM